MGTIGTCKVGTLRVGASSCVESWDAGVDLLAKDYTVFLGRADSAASELETDLSQEGVDLEASGLGYAYAFAGNADQFAIGSERALTFLLVGVTSSDSGYLCQYDESGPSTDTYALEVYDDGGTKKIRAYVNSDSSPEADSVLTLPGLSGTASDLAVKWASRDNPDAAGASDAVISRITVHNLTTGDHDVREWTHAAFNVGTGGSFAVGASDTLGSGSFGKHVVEIFRLDDRWVTDVELREDLEAITAVQTSTAIVETQHLQVDTGMGVHSRDEWHGPEYQLAARHAHDIPRRFVGVYPNERFRRVPTIEPGTSSGNPDHRLAPGETGSGTPFRIYMPWWFLVPVEDVVDRFWVRFHAKIWVTSGAAKDVGLRVYSTNRRPGNIGEIVLEPPEPPEIYYVGTSFTRDDGAGGSGSHTTLGPLKIARGTGLLEGMTWVGIGYQMDRLDTTLRLEIADLACFHYRRDPSAGDNFFGEVEDLSP